MSTNNCSDTLPAIEKTITHAQIRRYANTSGDFNPVHLDEQFAANSSFGRIVAHGMMTLAFLSEMMTARFGVHWLESGSLKVRFKRPAYPGDTLTTWGRVTDRKETPDHTLVKCDVALKSFSTDGSIIYDTITGSATLRIPLPSPSTSLSPAKAGVHLLPSPLNHIRHSGESRNPSYPSSLDGKE